MSTPETLGAAELMTLLPHRHPMVLLDGVTELIPGKSGIGLKNITISDPVFQGHFPGEPIYPGVFMIEAAAQLCGIILSRDSAQTEPRIGYLAAVKKFRFSELVRPGDSLRISATRGSGFGALTDFAVELRNGSTVVASGNVVIALGDA
ncbi:3-hydroxyacyl-ACP dehydratase FabZ [Mycetocola spongiae]|uniref:3-hydroxyacyl-ACP dehydratase FabZ n=1 Tax=Mycetocola spongiae TaxID=2859226 RepID=UPI001CF26791|nr:3-hydroxyacyl-ACP dehydratase FabZ [Mycetocola spongiae]UCR88462.1 3-hydroxyacyl-ACP dehydratase FabZ [Mycetocola spongiae]